MKVYIGVPAYGGIAPEFLRSLLAGALVLQAAGDEIELDLVTGCSLIAKARNEIVARFLASDYDALFFIDADMEFPPESVFDVSHMPQEIVCGGYVKKDGNAKLNVVPVMPPVMDNGAQELLRAGTGFMRVRREAFSRLSPPVADGVGQYFQCGVRDGQYWGEDYAFCSDFVAAGGKIWLATTNLGHVGSYVYRRAK